MLNSSIIRLLLLILSATRFVSSIPVPDSLTTTSTLFHTSPVPEECTTELQSVLLCENNSEWWKCYEFLTRHLNKDSKEYEQLETLRYSFQLLIYPLPPQAAVRGFTELIQSLFRIDLPVNRKYYFSEITMLHEAAQHGHDDMVALLLKQGADAQVKDWVGNTPLHKAVGHFQSTTVKLLLDAGAHVNVINNVGETPLFQAIKYICSSEYEFSSEYAPKTINRRYGILEFIIKMLLEYGADTNIPNYQGMTPLHVVAKNCDLTIVQLLIDKGANINATDVNNQTPLHVATESYNVPVVEYLITIGCDETVTDSKNKTALDIAKDNNFTKIVALLSRES